MLSDYELCIQLCSKRGISLPAEIMEAIKIGSSTGELRLSSQSIVMSVCEVIGRVLTSSTTIKTVDLSDCMLISKGLSKILDALSDGSNVTSLNLKGNNINGSIVSQLGDIFYHNNTLKYLFIEWNALGTDTESFEKFCKGLCVNHNIEEIDLRYNQISSHSAKALSNVLSKNKSLKRINLAWNSLSLHGGQLLLNGMKQNSTVIQLDLRGNRIPLEIIEVIENCTYTNQRKRIISQSDISKIVDTSKIIILHDKSQGIESISNDEFVEKENRLIKKKIKRKLRIDERKGDLIVAQEHQNKYEYSDTNSSNSSISLKVIAEQLNNNESKNNTSLMTNVTDDKNDSKETILDKKISELNKILHDRTSAISILKSEISIKDHEIETEKLLIEQLQLEINQLKEKNEYILVERKKKETELKLLQKTSEENWNKMYRELEKTHNIIVEKNKDLELKIRRYEHDIHKSSLEIISLREKWSNKTQIYEDLIAKVKTELHRGKRELQEKESRHKIELNILKNTLKDTTQALEECQTQLQKSRLELRDTTLNLSNVNSKLCEMEHLNAKYTRVDECLKKIKEEKSIIEEKFVDSQRTIASLKRQIITLHDELIEPQRRYNLLKDDLDNEKEKSSRLKQELVEDRARIKEQEAQMQMMNTQIKILNTQMNDIQKNYVDDIRERDREKKQLREVIISKERDLNDLKAEEAQRASHLYAAFSKYLSSIGSNAAL